jgi:hypothetical protein
MAYNENENITFFLNDENLYFDSEDDIDIAKLQNELNNVDISSIQDDDVYLIMKDYELNFNVKQLLLICEYYGISKDIRVNKLKKQDIIEQIILFEKNMENIEITIKRKEMWYYMSELKNDKMMKKFVIW